MTGYPIADDYKSKIVITRTLEPVILRKKVSELTDAELATIPAVRAKWEQDKAADAETKSAYHAEQNALHDKLKADLEAYHGVAGNPKADKLWAKANEKGHGSGLGEVITIYGDLVELID